MDHRSEQGFDSDGSFVNAPSPHEGRTIKSNAGVTTNSATASISRRAGPVKSCNECRQQKLRCDVVKEPFSSCTRCRRYNIECTIDSNFTRVGKRNKNAELQKENRELRRQLAARSKDALQTTTAAHTLQQLRAPFDPPRLSINAPASNDQSLEEITVSGESLANIYELFFAFYHPICPVLDNHQDPNHFFAISPLLGWTVVLIGARRYAAEPDLLSKLAPPFGRLLWATISKMPQSYHVVKVLSLICTWPLPLFKDAKENALQLGKIGLSEMDPTFMNSGIMMQIAMQTGLHRALHANDFIRQSRDVLSVEVEDRKLTWAICNIVSQGVSISCGQPSMSIFDWNLGQGLSTIGGQIGQEVVHRLHIARFCDRLTRDLYSNPADVAGIVAESEQVSVIANLKMDIQRLDALSVQFSPISKLYLLFAKVHFYSFVFLMHRGSPEYPTALSNAYTAATTFIQTILDVDLHSCPILQYCPSDLQRALISATCILIKILHSSYASSFDVMQGKSLFNAAVLALRTISLRKNDFPDRLSEALARMWRASGSGNPGGQFTRSGNDPLDLNVRSRMSASHTFDCIWKWRKAITTPASAAQHNHPTLNTPGNQQTISLQPDLSHTLLQSNFVPENFNDISTLQDFDLFSSLGWAIDDDSYFGL